MGDLLLGSMNTSENSLFLCVSTYLGTSRWRKARCKVDKMKIHASNLLRVRALKGATASWQVRI